MNITSVKPAERFDNTEFDNVVWDGEARSINTAYTCPKCGERIGFQKRNFEDAKLQQHTNLASEVARCFDEFALEHLSRARNYLDWLCPECGLPARVYVEFWAGGKCECGINLVAVLEATPS